MTQHRLFGQMWIFDPSLSQDKVVSPPLHGGNEILHELVKRFLKRLLAQHLLLLFSLNLFFSNGRPADRPYSFLSTSPSP